MENSIAVRYKFHNSALKIPQDQKTNVQNLFTKLTLDLLYLNRCYSTTHFQKSFNINMA